MIIKVFGKVNQKYIDNVLKKAGKLISVPKDLTIYFLETLSFCSYINLPRTMQNKVRQKCMTNISFSFIFKKRKIVVIHLEKNLEKNQDSLVGLLIHEIAHINQMEKGVYIKIYNDYYKVSQRNLIKIKKLKYNKKDLVNLFHSISITAVFALKDIYANNYLIEKGLVNHLLSYYKMEFNKKVCPKPFFYKNLKIAAKKDMSIVKDVVDFQLAILSATLPIHKTRKAKELINFIEKCYSINIQEVSEKMHELVNLYFKSFKNKDFNKMFFDCVFKEVYKLLK
ncbi:hypothetical protein HYX16_02880 [Candidatus Woesearchaeota archaeon]|nr:hypothetical protein [Candidatus Woesearchaeota archaeon]